MIWRYLRDWPCRGRPALNGALHGVVLVVVLVLITALLELTRPVPLHNWQPSRRAVEQAH
jgi:hypothetical protein